jgi:hypothetical protein
VSTVVNSLPPCPVGPHEGPPWGGDRAFTRTRPGGEVAPIPAVCRWPIGYIGCAAPPSTVTLASKHLGLGQGASQTGSDRHDSATSHNRLAECPWYRTCARSGRSRCRPALWSAWAATGSAAGRSRPAAISPGSVTCEKQGRRCVNRSPWDISHSRACLSDSSHRAKPKHERVPLNSVSPAISQAGDLAAGPPMVRARRGKLYDQ